MKAKHERSAARAAMLPLAAMAIVATIGTVAANPGIWEIEWPATDFKKHSVPFDEILSGGPPKDGIRSIDDPSFIAVSDNRDLKDDEPVIGVVINGDARAYPLGILTQHEIVNDVVGGVPVAVTYCPLCNSSIVFDRRLDGRVLEFGTSGKLRNSDLVMYDRLTESWWQQFLGEAIVGELTGKRLKMLPSRMESFARFRERAPKGKLLASGSTFRRYGINPYVRYDSRSAPYPFFTGDLPEGVPAMMRVVVVDGEAWTLPLLRSKGSVKKGDIEISWVAGQNSALDTRRIADGRDVGNVVVRRAGGGKAEDVVHDVTFAFVFHAFHPEGVINQQ